jgi:transposase InsO family protein
VSPSALAVAEPDRGLVPAGPRPDGGTPHLERLQALCAGAAPAAPPERRGSSWQQPRRRLEQQVRQQAVCFRQELAARGLDRMASAAWLGISPWTLRAWEQRRQAAAAPVVARGRPVLRSDRAARGAVLEFLESVGPGVGRAVLAGQFPDLPPAELADLLRRYRRVWVRRQAQWLHVLHWQQPGAVWAIDYARPPLPLEEGYTDLLAVRDLASGMQLLWLPVPAATAATTTAALLALFTVYGAPLVLKPDNGPAFVAEATQELLAQWQVMPLYSPPGRPQYNGSIEAGIGALKVRTHYEALRQGRPEAWTLADTEAARQAGNVLGRPWGAHGPTPAERWPRRPVVTLAERQTFTATVACLEEATAAPAPSAVPVPAAQAAPGAGAAPAAPGAAVPPSAGTDAVAASCAPGTAAGSNAHPAVTTGPEHGGASTPGAAADAAAQRRQAISRALVAHGYLVFTRRRIPPPIRRKKVT